MYTYEYEKVVVEFSGFGLFNGNMYGIEEYRDIIEKRAKDGWRYVGFIPTRQRGTGHIDEIDLIFEKLNQES